MPQKEIIYQNNEVTTVGKKLNIIHFNDVYNIESGTIEPLAGAARFINAVEDILKSEPSTIVLFSGDAISPSNS
jgi:5'-nucleotidase